jgi:hypothetical protein
MICSKAPLIYQNNKDKKETEEQIERLKIKLLSEVVIELQQTLSEKNLKLLYHNLKTVKIQKSYLLLLTGRAAIYNVKDNSLTYCFDKSLFHDLCHLASSWYDKDTDTVYSGFEQAKKGASIGRGITDGYIEHFASKHCTSDRNKAYGTPKRIVEEMELLFKSPKTFENLFYNLDLPGLIQYLEKYSSKDNAINLIRDTDKIHNYRCTFNFLLMFITSTKVQVELYKWALANNIDTERLQKLQALVSKNPVAHFIINRENIKNSVKEKKMI